MPLRVIAIGVVVMALASPLALAASRQTAAPDPNASPTYRLLNKPTSSDERLVQRGLQKQAQSKSDSLFAALASLLGGMAPAINTVRTGSPLALGDAHISTNPATGTNPYAPPGTINADPLAMAALLDVKSPWHNGFVNYFPHEMAHTRQIPDVTSSLPNREGSAQAFADYVTPHAAQVARIPYAPGPPGNFDGAYADFTKAAQAKGLAWLLGGQFGKTAPPSWP